jgi:hypothetical protein
MYTAYTKPRWLFAVEWSIKGRKCALLLYPPITARAVFSFEKLPLDGWVYYLEGGYHAHACLLVGALFLPRWRGMGNTLKHHSFSGQLHSAHEWYLSVL